MTLAERITSRARIPWAKLQGFGNNDPKQGDIDKDDFLDLKTFISDCDKAFSHTPDWMPMEELPVQPVFVYCNMQYRGKEHNVIENIMKQTNGDVNKSPYAFTQECYEVWQTRDGINSIPIALTSRAPKLSNKTGTFQPTLPRASVLRGRVYFIPSGFMNELDYHKKNGIIHSRRKITVRVPYQITCYDLYRHPFEVEDVRDVEVWAYLGKHRYWDEHLDGGFTMDKCRLHDYRPADKPSNKLGASQPFYYFNAAKIARGDFT